MLVNIIHDGIAHIINGFGGHITGWARVILDLIAVIGDIGVIVVSGLFFTQAVMERGAAWMNFFQKMGFIFDRLRQYAARQITEGVVMQAAITMGTSMLAIFAGLGDLYTDTRTLIGDTQAALATP